MFRISGLIGLAACAAVGGAEVAPPPRAVDVPALVRQLASDDPAARDTAEARLSRLSAVPPELLAATRFSRTHAVPPERRAATRADDADVRRRAAAAAAAIRARVEPPAPTRSERFARRGRVDLYVAATAADRWDDDSPRAWDPALALGKAVIHRCDTSSSRGPGNDCPGRYDFATLREGNAAEFRITAGRRTADELPMRGGTLAAGLDCRRGFYLHTVVSRGPLKVGRVSTSLVVANGDFECRGEARFNVDVYDVFAPALVLMAMVERYAIDGAVVVCDGDARIDGNVYNSIIISRGNIVIKGYASANTLVAGGTVTVARTPQPHPAGEADIERLRRNIVQEGVRRPLDYFSFFELSDLGLEVKAAGKAVAVSSVVPTGAAGDAGVKTGDVVAAVNGTVPTDPEHLRRLLRDALAVGDATLALKRDDKTVEVKVSLPE